MRFIPVTREVYFKLVEATERAIRHDERGSIDSKSLPILKRLGFNKLCWMERVSRFNCMYPGTSGTADYLLKWEKRQRHKTYKNT